MSSGLLCAGVDGVVGVSSTVVGLSRILSVQYSVCGCCVWVLMRCCEDGLRCLGGSPYWSSSEDMCLAVCLHFALVSQ